MDFPAEHIKKPAPKLSILERRANCKTLNELKSLGQELGYSEGWANYVWSARKKH